MPHESMPAGAGLNIPDPDGGVQGPGHHVDPVELKIRNHEDWASVFIYSVTLGEKVIALFEDYKICAPNPKGEICQKRSQIVSLQCLFEGGVSLRKTRLGEDR